MARKRLSNLNSEEPKNVEPVAKLDKEVAKSDKEKENKDKEESGTVSPPKLSKPNSSSTKAEKEKTSEEIPEKTTLKETFPSGALAIDVPSVEIKPDSATGTQDAERSDSRQSLVPKPEEISQLETGEPSSEKPSSEKSRSEKSSHEKSSSEKSGTEQALGETIAKLNSTLDTVRQTAKHRENELLDQITELQSTLETKQTQIEQLQAELQQTNQLKSELEDAKKMILQLSQVNAQPASPVSSGSTPSKPLPSQMRPAEPELETSNTQLIHPPSAKPQRDDRKPAPVALQRQPSYPARQAPLVIPPERQPVEKLSEQDGKLTDADLGWVD